MAKTYILEPTTLTFIQSDPDEPAVILYEDESDFPISIDEFEQIYEGTVATVSGVKLLYAGIIPGVGKSFTPDGTISESEDPELMFSVNFITKLDDTCNEKFFLMPGNGDETISIYNGEDEEDPTPSEGGIPGLEDKNVVYEYQLVANNSINDILMAVIEKNGDNAVNIPGYSVMELLVENLLVFHSITGETLTAFRSTTFANDAEKIAWIIRNA